MYNAIANSDVEFVRQQLLEHKIDVNATINEMPLLIYATLELNAPRLRTFPYLEFVDLLLEYGADINTRDITGNTPLHILAFNRNTRNMRALVDRGADVFIKNNAGLTPLMLFMRITEIEYRDCIDSGIDEIILEYEGFYNTEYYRTVEYMLNHAINKSNKSQPEDSEDSERFCVEVEHTV